MILDALALSNWVLNFNSPAIAVVYKPKQGSASTLLGVTGIAAGMGYMLSDSLTLNGEYQLHYSLATTTIFWHGYDFSFRKYLSGGYAIARDTETMRALVAPNYSIFIDFRAGQRFFDLRTPEAMTEGTIQVPKSKSYSSSGSMFGVGASLGIERVLFTESFRVGLSASAVKSLMVTTALSFTEYQGRISLTYQM